MLEKCLIKTILCIFFAMAIIACYLDHYWSVNSLWLLATHISVINLFFSKKMLLEPCFSSHCDTDALQRNSSSVMVTAFFNWWRFLTKKKEKSKKGKKE